MKSTHLFSIAALGIGIGATAGYFLSKDARAVAETFVRPDQPTVKPAEIGERRHPPTPEPSIGDSDSVATDVRHEVEAHVAEADRSERRNELDTTPGGTIAAVASPSSELLPASAPNQLDSFAERMSRAKQERLRANQLELYRTIREFIADERQRIGVADRAVSRMMIAWRDGMSAAKYSTRSGPLRSAIYDADQTATQLAVDYENQSDELTRGLSRLEQLASPTSAKAFHPNRLNELQEQLQKCRYLQKRHASSAQRLCTYVQRVIDILFR